MIEPGMAADDPIRKEWDDLIATRNEPLERARENASFTLPWLMPEEGHNETSRVAQPWQSVGGRGLTNLGSRITTTLFPPNIPNWRATVTRATLESEGMTADEQGEFDSALSGFEQDYRRSFESSGDRAVITEALRTHLGTGDVLLRFNHRTGKLRYYRLNQFVVRRDLDGDIQTIIVKEVIGYKSLPDDIRDQIPAEDPSGKQREDVVVFTKIERLEGGRFSEGQYIDGNLVEGTEGEYPTELKTPWRVLRYTQVPGENYGRAYLDDHIADLMALDSFMQSTIQGTALAVKTLFFVRPGSSVTRKQLQQARNGDTLIGQADDVTVFTLDKNFDFRIAFQMIEKLEQRLGFSFLLNSAVTRDAERVTAEEIRFMAQELEAALGGFYARLATDLQLWYIKQRLAYMENEEDAPALPEELVDVQITTGVDALGRRVELDNLDLFLVGILEKFGPQMFQQIINMNEYLRRRAAALGIDTRNLVKSEQETQAEADDEQVQGIARDVAPEAARFAGQQIAQAQPSPLPAQQ